MLKVGIFIHTLADRELEEEETNSHNHGASNVPHTLSQREAACILTLCIGYRQDVPNGANGCS